MKLTLEIIVTDDANVGIRTEARGMSEAQIRPAMDKAIRALTAERAAIDACPYHRATRPNPEKATDHGE